MKTILEELWYGNICPDSDCRQMTDEAKAELKRLVDYQNNLLSTMTDEQKELLATYDECYAGLCGINEREIFVYAFRLGAQIAFAMM